MFKKDPYRTFGPEFSSIQAAADFLKLHLAQGVQGGRMKTDELFYFIKEREAVRAKKEAGLPKPWTDDKILQQFRFCNAYREYDTVSLWIQDNWIAPNEEDPNLWFAMAVARFINWPPTLEIMGYPKKFSVKSFVAAVEKSKQENGKSWSGAYLIGAPGGGGQAKAQYIGERVLAPLWEVREYMSPYENFADGLRVHNEALMEFRGLGGGFMSAQIIADYKQAPRYRSAPDWWTFVSSGPGSRRGLNRVIGYSVDARWNEDDWKAGLWKLQEALAPLLKKARLARMCAQNTQNCLCEYDKYMRVKLGEGRPRQNYPGG